ncbi:MAG: L,D-transpeptidase family protein [Planctomycetota bacterium]|nr:L,D-transpeptidase family protein [Planctomycetota bacterium]
MALASQSARSGSRRAYMTSRRRRRRGRWMLLLVLVAGAVGAWWWFERPEARESDETATTTREPKAVVVEDPTRSGPAAAPTPRRRTPSMDPVTRDRSPNRRSSNGEAGSDRPEPDSRTAGVGVVELEPRSTTPAPQASPPPTTTEDSKSAGRRTNPGGTNRSVAGIEQRTIATRRLRQASELSATNPVDARRALGEAWIAGLSGPDRGRARDLSRRLGDATLLENPEVPGSPWTRSYLIRPGDSMSVIMSRERVPTSQTFVARLNGLRNANAIKAGDPLQLPTGRFHAVVDLSSRDLALFQEVEGSRDLLVVMPLAVGPRLRSETEAFEGLYQATPRGKRRNPSWTDPISGDRWDRSDPENPVGEHWIGLRGLGDDDLPDNLGLHGTNDPGGIPSGRLPGSIALADEDIELLYQVLDTGDSTVEIRK